MQIHKLKNPGICNTTLRYGLCEAESQRLAHFCSMKASLSGWGEDTRPIVTTFRLNSHLPCSGIKFPSTEAEFSLDRDRDHKMQSEKDTERLSIHLW